MPNKNEVKEVFNTMSKVGPTSSAVEFKGNGDFHDKIKRQKRVQLSFDNFINDFFSHHCNTP